MKEKLTPKQELFCKEYLVDLNATQAAIRSGYSEKTAKDIGCQNLAKLYIQERIQELMIERQKRTEITADYVLNNIKTIGERCMQVIPVTEKVDGQIVETGEYKFDSNGALKSQELLGKHLCLFTDKINHDGELNITVSKRVLSARDTD